LGNAKSNKTFANSDKAKSGIYTGACVGKMCSAFCPVNNSTSNWHGGVRLRVRRQVAFKLNFVFSLFARAVVLLICVGARAPADGVELWVSRDGSDHNAGTRQHPLASIAAALREARVVCRRENIGTDKSVEIFLRGGIYPLAGPLRIGPEDSGTATSPTVIAAAPGERPLLSGGVAIGGWQKLAGQAAGLTETARGKIWVAAAPKVHGRILRFRELWVNGRKAIRAREPNCDNLSHLVAWNKAGQMATIPSSALCGIKDPSQLEMVIDQVWGIADLRVKKIRTEGTNAVVMFRRPERKIEFRHPWPPVIVNAKYSAPFFLANAVEFLNSPGEWYEDLKAGKVYYWPRDGEEMARAEVIVPALETLVTFKGTLGQPVSNVQFKGISFAYSAWLRPSEKGHVPLQAGMFLLAARKLSPRGTSYHPRLDNVAWIGRPPAAVSVENANHISFERCTFEHTASAGLDFESGTHDDLVEGCVFRDIGGNGIQLGKFSDKNVETHMPYNPKDEREICTRETISNNLITDCGAEDWGCVGICVGYARDIRIEHNEIFNLPYTGVSVGWGWTKMTNALRDNLIFANRIHDVGRRLGDLGGIYTLSAQPGTMVAENSVFDIRPGPFVPDPRHWFYLYADEGSSFETFRDNWCPAEKFLRNANGPGNVWTNNGPMVSATIKNAAGLEPAFQDLLTGKTP
jgi:GH141 insertion domain/Right handed beta helix region